MGSVSISQITEAIGRILDQWEEDTRFEGLTDEAVRSHDGALLSLALATLEELKEVNDAAKATIPQRLVSDEENLRMGEFYSSRGRFDRWRDKRPQPAVGVEQRGKAPGPVDRTYNHEVDVLDGER